MDKKHIAILKKQIDAAPYDVSGEESSELAGIIQELSSKTELDNQSEENISCLLLLGISLTKSGHYVDAAKYLKNGVSMLNDPKQDRLKKEFILALIKLGEEMQRDKKLKNQGIELITNSRDLLISQYERNEKWDNFFKEVAS